ncbi:MAG: M6 family metalloprotease domain-containing protein [Calditrichaeota bacterium]|nr:M6 family metalloprotease domain-containing protein [Calditrichota bacterium]
MLYKHRFFSFLSVLLIVILNSSAFAIPPMNPGPEPDYPEGVNVPDRSAIMRDDADIEGEWNCLIILIDFEDYPWDFQEDENFPNEDRYYTPEHFENMLFSLDEFRYPESESEYTGSMRDYFLEVSDGVFETIGVTTEWYRASEPLTYYCNNDGEADTYDDHGFGEYPHNVQRLVEEAIALADDDVDFSDFDNDEDGNVDALFVVHSGPGAAEFAEGEGIGYIWSHKWQIPEVECDDVWIWSYSMEPENGKIGVFCHEFGHVLGLPDLYDIDGTSEGIGEWGLMGSGGWNYRPGDPPGTCPAHFSGWSKKYFEWVEVIQVQETLIDEVIRPVENEPVVYQLWTGGRESQEYFLIEHRQRIGFDAGLTRRQIGYNLPAPGGLLITHIDDSLYWNDNDHHRLVDVEEASIVFIDNEPFEQLDGDRRRPDDRSLYRPNRGDNGDLWPGFSEHNEDSTDWIGERDRDTFSTFSTPSSESYDGEPTLVRVSQMRIDQNNNIVCNIEVEAGGPFLNIESWLANDDDGGNGNGFIEPGETIDLSVTLENIGEDAAHEITALITCDGELLEVVRDSVDYPDIEIDESADPEEPFQIRISDDAPDYSPVDMILSVSCTEESWDIPLRINIRPPSDWQKHPDNPVFSGNPESWDSMGVQSPSVIVEGDTLKCWYVGLSGDRGFGYNGVGFAWSLDGGVIWQRREDPVLLRDPDLELMEMGITDVSVLTIENGYLMILITRWSIMNSYYEGILWQAESEDGINWELNREPIINTNEGWFYIPLSNSQPSLYRLGDADEIMLAFAAVNMRLLGNGIATASTNDLEDWTVQQNPLITSTGNSNQFDGGAIYSPDISFNEGKYTLLYGGINERSAYDFLTEHTGRLGIMTSENGDDFQRQEGYETGGAVLEPDERENWREQYIIGGRIFVWHGQYRMLYCASDSITRYGFASPSLGLAMGAEIQSAVDFDDFETSMPSAILLNPAYPNAFNAATVITFRLPAATNISLTVFDLSGRKVRTLFDGHRQSGIHTVGFDAGEMPSGLYFIRLDASGELLSRKVMLIR